MALNDFRAGYVDRVIDDELDDLLGVLPAVLLDGPKAVGKTATGLQRCRSVRRLDDQVQRSVLEAAPMLLANDEAPVLIDEWQRLPVVFDVVRRLVDDHPHSGPYLLTGSAPVASTHSGAGRIVTMRMRPLALSERLDDPTEVSLARLLAGSGVAVGGRCALSLVDYVDEIMAGGFPGLRHLEGRALERQLDGYLDRIVDHDLSELGLRVRRPRTVLAWLRAYAAATSTTTSWDKIRNAATTGVDVKPAKTTTMPYIELLTALRILDPLDAWLPSHNHLAALNAAPKHHLADPALAARLVGRTATQLLHGGDAGLPVARDGSYLGALFESLVALSLRVYAQSADARVFHLRTKGGRHEVDFVVEGKEGVVAVEAKLGGTVGDHDVKHLRWLRDKLGDECVDTVVVTTGPEAYRRRDGVAVVPLGALGP